jgi:hypothetical protein
MNIKNNYQEDKITANTINKGNPIYYKKLLHYIVYEFGDNILISANKDLSKAFCLKKSKVSVKPIR